MRRRSILSFGLLATINPMKSFKIFLNEMAPPQQKQINCDINGICNRLIQDESAGNEEKILSVYKDSKGLDTLGHGHLVGPNSEKVLGQVIKDPNRVKKILSGKGKLTQGEATGVLKVDVESRLPQLVKMVPKFETYTPDLQINLASEHFRGMLGKSPNAVKKLNAGDYGGFATEYVNAKDYRESKKTGTGIYKRMDRLVNSAKTEAERQKKRQQSSQSTTQAPLNNSTSQTAPSR